MVETHQSQQDKALRTHLVDLLGSGNAHVTIDRAVTGLPAKLRGVRPPQAPHSPWQILDHLRIAQWDILEFSRNPSHRSPDWPAGFWPRAVAPPTANAWGKAVSSFRADLDAMKALIADPENDLFAKIPHGDGQTLLREALLLADHNAYHLGELVLVRRLLGAWKEG